MSEIANQTVSLPDVELTCLTSPSIDDHNRPLVICVHGFPDSAHSWRHLMPVLEDAGFRVAAPFIRGYAPSTVSGSGAYQTGASALDICALHRHFRGDDRAVLIGHDWGAPIVYGAASIEPSSLGESSCHGGSTRRFDGPRLRYQHRSAQTKLVHVFFPARTRRHGGTSERHGVHRHDLEGLVARIRRDR